MCQTMKIQPVAMSPQLLHMLQSLYKEIHIINLETHSAYCLLPDSKSVMVESSYIPVWEDYVNTRDELLYENHKNAIRKILSCESLVATFKEGKYSFSCVYPGREGEMHCVSFKVTIGYQYFDEQYPKALCARVIVTKETIDDLGCHVIMEEVYNESDGYYCIDVINERFITLRGAESQMGLLSRHFKGYEDLLRNYIDTYVVPEEQESVWREAKLETVLQCLEEKRIHSFYCNIILDDGTVASREWQFSYYDKMTKRILLHRADVSDLYVSQRKLQEAWQVAETDSLTGIYNYRGIVSKVKSLLSTDSKQAALLFLDLDNFKQVNDLFGHLMGDFVLKQVATTFSHINWTDSYYVGRVGGDEFVVFLPYIESERSVACYAEAVCKALSTIIIGSNNTFKISGSVGISFSSRDGKSYETLLQVADERAYKAKKRGKNCFVMN